MDALYSPNFDNVGLQGSNKTMVTTGFSTIRFSANALECLEELDDRRAQCPVTETVDSLRIIIADWADGREKGERRYFSEEGSRGAQWFVILHSP